MERSIKIRHLIILFALVTFFTSGIGKLGFLATKREVFDYPNPIFPFLSNRIVLTVAAILELGVCVFAFRYHSARPTWALAALAWLASVITYYRLSIHLSGTQANSCGCLGFVGSFIYGTNTANKEAALAGMLLYAVLVSTALGLVVAKEPPSAYQGRKQIASHASNAHQW